MASIQHKRSNALSDVLSDAQALAPVEGELAIQIHTFVPRIWIEMESGGLKEFNGMAVGIVEPTNPWEGLMWVDITNGAQRIMVYGEGSFQRMDQGAINPDNFMPTNADATTTGSVTAEGDLNTDGDANVAGVVQVQDGTPLGKTTLTTTTGQPSGGAHGDVVMVHD